MKGYFSKKLQNSQRYQEYRENQTLYYEHSLVKEQKQKNYLQNNTFMNCVSGECLTIDYDFEKKYKEYAKTTEQRISTIEHLAKEKEYISVFITLTLPSAYHPFTSIKKGDGRLYIAENKEFSFLTIKDAVSEGYQYLQHIYQTFYKRVKNFTKNELYYVKCVEHHTTMIPHMHIVLYFPVEQYENVYGTFKRVIEYFGLDRVDFEQSNFINDLTYASRYLLKYITKNLNSGSDYFQARVLDGWKRFHKIRILTSSELPLTVDVYKKIYRSISNISKNKINSKSFDKIVSAKKKIDETVATLGIPYYLFFQENLYLERHIRSSKEDKVLLCGNKDALIRVKMIIEKNNKNYSVKAFRITFCGVELYKKTKYIKISNI